MRNKKKLIIISSVVIVLILGGMGLWLGLTKKRTKVESDKIVDKITGFDYLLDSNQTELFKNKFKELKKELSNSEIDYDNYLKLLVQLFISDFYNLNNKTNKTDIGGLQFIHPEAKINFTLNAQETIYNHIESDFTKNRKQELPIVKNISIEDIENKEYEYLDKKDENAYYIDAKWEYEKDLKYQNKALFIVVQEEKKLSIVEIQN